jgi:hypothetical protein
MKMKRFMICLASLAFALALAAGAGAEIAQRETLYVDDGDGEPFYTETGSPWSSSSGFGWNGTHRYVQLDDPSNLNQTARWAPDIINSGYYLVSFYLPPTSNSRNHALYIVSAFGSDPDSGWYDQNYNSGNFIPLGIQYLAMGMSNYVEVVNDSTSTTGYIFRADATRFILGSDERDFEPQRRNAYNFGEVGILTSRDWVLRIYNIGGADLTINEVNFGTAAFSLYDPAPPITIPAREYVDLTLRFLPYAEDTFSDIMTIHSDDPDEPTWNLSLSGEGVGQYVVVNNDDSAPTYIEEIGEWMNSNGVAQCPGITNNTSRYAIQSTNPGATATITPDIPVEGFYRVYFAGPLTSNASDNALCVIRPWGSSPDSVWFDQNTGANCEWKLMGVYYLVAGTDNSVSIINDGTGAGYVLRTDLMKFTNVPDFPVIYLATNRHTFDDVPIDETPSWSFEIQNVGNADMTIFNILNNNPDFFTLTNPTSFPVTVDALGSITATVQFHPTEIDSFEARLRIASDAANYDTLSVYLDGNGIGNWVQVDDTDELGFTMGHYELGIPVAEDTTWQLSTSIYGVNETSLFTSLLWHPDAFCKWTPDVPTGGNYDVYVSSVPSQNSCDRAPFFVNYSLGLVDTVQVDQNTTTSDNVWLYLGRYDFVEGTIGFVELINDTSIIQPTEADTVVLRADAIKLTEAPTGVAVATFFAEIEDEGVAVHWSTTDPYHLDQFNIYRLTRQGARPRPQDRINHQPLRGTSPYVYLDKDVLPGEIYYYWLEQIDETGQSTFHGPAVANLSALVPESYALYQNYPNPFNPETTIRYALPREEKVTLQIFNIRGQMVKTLIDEPVKAGYHSLVWNGRNEAGRAVASGIYFVQLQAGAYQQTRKLALIK